MDSKIEIIIWKGKKHVGKRRKCWLPAFSPFSLMFSKEFFFKVIKSQELTPNQTTKFWTLYRVESICRQQIKMTILSDRVENISGKEENAGNLHDILSPQFSQSFLLKGHSKSGLCVKQLTLYHTIGTFND